MTAYLRWADAQAAASTDEHVQGVLARTAVDDFATERPQGEPGCDLARARDYAAGCAWVPASRCTMFLIWLRLRLRQRVAATQGPVLRFLPGDLAMSE